MGLLHPKPAPPTSRSSTTIPEPRAGPFSRLTFGWLSPVLWTGYTRPLEIDDLWSMDKKRLTEEISAELEKRFWERCPPEQRPGGRPQPAHANTVKDGQPRSSSISTSTTSSSSTPTAKGQSSAPADVATDDDKYPPSAAATAPPPSSATAALELESTVLVNDPEFSVVADLDLDQELPAGTGDRPALDRTFSLVETKSRTTTAATPAGNVVDEKGTSFGGMGAGGNGEKKGQAGAAARSRRFRNPFRRNRHRSSTLTDASSSQYDRSLPKALLWTMRKQFLLAILFKLCAAVISTTSSLVTKRLITYITREHAERTGDWGTGIGLAIGLAAMQEAQSLSNNHYFAQSMGAGWMMRAALIDQISRKSLRLSSKARLEVSNGRLVTSVSGDCSFLDFASPMFVEAIVEPITIIVGFGLLIGNLGYSAVVGLAVLLASTPFMGWLFGKMIGSRQAQMKLVDGRVRLLNEVLNNIRQVKLNAYESLFMQKLLAFRSKELGRLRLIVRNRAVMIATMTLLPTAAAVLTFITYGLSGHALNPATIFASLQLFAIVQQPLRILPLAFTALTDTYVALVRISKILLADELLDEPLKVDTNARFALEVQDGDFTFESSKPPDSSTAKSGFGGRDRKKSAEKRKKKSELKKLNKQRKKQGLEPLQPEDDVKEDLGTPFTLENIALEIPRGSFVVIVGRIGNGKSALLQALIGEMRQTRGPQPVFGGKVSYVAQQPWVQNATVRENIVFGQDLDTQRLATTIESCALGRDIEQFAAGLDTEIGERGITLSGGQKARLCLGRAVYFNAEVILMDDVLAAVDSHVAHHLIEHCLLAPDVLGKKTRILVSHQLSVVPHADLVLVVESGKIVQKGSPTELMEDQEGIFHALMEEYGTQHEEANEEIELEVTKTKTSKATKEVTTADASGKTPASATGGAGGLISAEERNTGAVSWGVYLLYARHMGPLCFLALLFLLVAQASQVGNTLFLGFWSGESIKGFTQGEYIGVYAALGVAYALFTFCGSLTLSLAGLNASYNFFDGALKGVMRSPVSFHDSTPIGRIISRLSKDIEMIDDRLTFQWYQVLAQAFQVIGTVFLVFYTFAYLGIIFVPMLILYGTAASFYRRTSREVKRIDSITRSFIYSSFQEQLSGLASVRAYKQQDTFRRKLQHNIDVECRCYYTTIILQRWLGVRLDFLGSLLVLGVALFGVGFRSSVSPSKLGVVLTYSLQTTAIFSQLVNAWAQTEQEMNNVERVSHYGQLPLEAPPRDPRDPPKSWPTRGHVVFEDVQMRYREGLPLVLKGLSLEIQPGWKVGIVGRTGAGKSTLGQVLFRMVELAQGKIVIDGVDIKNIGLDTLREQLSIIPQDSLLYAGTIKENIDPTGEHTDEQLNEALRRCGLVPTETERNKQRYEKFQIGESVADEGTNFSGGERQLVALARALVKGRKLLLLDEATSSVDVETDAIIQRTIRSEFADVTLISIAHRLATVAFYDRILVMDDGRVAEYDTPLNLFDDIGSSFRSMCDAAGLTRSQIERIRAGGEDLVAVLKETENDV